MPQMTEMTLAPFTAHLVRLAVWGMLSLAAGLVLRRRRADPFMAQASLHCLLWGGINAALAVAGWYGEPPSAAFLWVNVGLDVGYVGVGLTLLLMGRHFTSRGPQGAGVTVAVQGVVLLVFDLVYLAEYA